MKTCATCVHSIFPDKYGTTRTVGHCVDMFTIRANIESATEYSTAAQEVDHLKQDIARTFCEERCACSRWGEWVDHIEDICECYSEDPKDIVWRA